MPYRKTCSASGLPCRRTIGEADQDRRIPSAPHQGRSELPDLVLPVLQRQRSHRPERQTDRLRRAGLEVAGMLWVANTYIPMDQKIKTIMNIVVMIAVVLWLLQAFGVLGSLESTNIGR